MPLDLIFNGFCPRRESSGLIGSSGSWGLSTPVDLRRVFCGEVLSREGYFVLFPPDRAISVQAAVQLDISVSMHPRSKRT
ncbi:UNVERIFIED_CONTAM: hypothetical protein Slati_2701300 [Sesamum latifolium]|uniref:Uncharacterized protein n=1 Tax=Sesamum latifolium TaxID=2727402 RepID=A0AAW2VXQ3_9LAMI